MSIQILNGHVYMMDEPEVVQDVVQPTRRRRHSKEFKQMVIRAAMQPNVSIAAVALHYRLNANLLRGWVAAQEERDVAEAARQELNVSTSEFVPLQMQNGFAGATHIEIEVRRGATSITVRWPLSAASDCATWLQGWLR
ncbi:transposase IS3/IS911 family protein [Caballeronia hypogeia]|uniref:Transposase IS3/IS911 family protein n=2 Tax=Caballeronia TaxID=1827195 RepID=A0A157ZWB2_9BURK|nr:transposase [Caballeronia hypogeia]SAK49779.1 transposase IS3/IS911 family protein [Caballeronia hypogeia]